MTAAEAACCDLLHAGEPEPKKRLPPEAVLEQLRFNGDLLIAKFNERSQRSLEAFKASVEAGLEALRATTLLNGGGAVAMLALIGDFASTPNAVGNLRHALVLFVAGAFLSVVASGLTYFAQKCVTSRIAAEASAPYNDEEARKHVDPQIARWRVAFRVLNGLAILSAAGALGCFVAGACYAYVAFDTLSIQSQPASAFIEGNGLLQLAG